ncbi:MAG TPA: class I SAM-dependent methyltransferase [Paludibacteraceae bacterium]|nr:class I SAM-dependent methyltransferase [Paludibacteraceae bacterium]
MQKRYLNAFQYINEQAYTTEKYILPFIREIKEINTSTRVLEIGCGEAGNLKPFLDAGCKCTGIDISSVKIEKGKEFFATHPLAENLTLICQDIYQINNELHDFDIIILRDVIEHMPDKEKLLNLLKKWLAVDGIVFIAFPPWQNPFGGHQQICESKFLSVLPYFHLLPISAYKNILKLFGEKEGKINTLLEIKQTGISLENFEQLVKKNDFQILKKVLYFINPNYEIKFGLKPRKLFSVFADIPYFRNFFTTAGYYILQPQKRELA